MNRTEYVQNLLYKVKENADQLRANNYQLYTGNLNAISGYTKEGIIVTNLSAVNLTLSKHHLIYKFTNTINGAFYIGKHTTRNPLDSYYGSGIILHEAQIKYGLSSFNKEILFDFENVEDCFAKEAELIPELSCHDYNRLCYNMKAGGKGGQGSESALCGVKTRKANGYVISKQTKLKISISNQNKPKSNTHKQHLSENHRYRRQLIIQFEFDNHTEVVMSSICSIAKQYNISQLKLKRNSRKGKFTNGIRILTLMTQPFLYTKNKRIQSPQL